VVYRKNSSPRATGRRKKKQPREKKRKEEKKTGEGAHEGEEITQGRDAKKRVKREGKRRDASKAYFRRNVIGGWQRRRMKKRVQMKGSKAGGGKKKKKKHMDREGSKTFQVMRWPRTTKRKEETKKGLILKGDTMDSTTESEKKKKKKRHFIGESEKQAPTLRKGPKDQPGQSSGKNVPGKIPHKKKQIKVTGEARPLLKTANRGRTKKKG